MFNRTITINGKTLLGYSWKTPATADEAWEIIKMERTLRQREGGYKIDTNWYHSDQTSKIQQMGLVLLGQSMPTNLMWKTMQGTFVQMTPALAQQIFQMAAYTDGQLFAVAEGLKQQVSSQGYDLTTFNPTVGWPQAFWEV